MPIKHLGFQSLLYFKVIHSKLYRVEDVARKMGESPATLYGYIEGKATFPPDLIGPLYNATRDQDFLNFILNDTDQMLAARQAAREVRSVLEETLDVAAAAGGLSQLVQRAMADGDIDEVEARRVQRSINNVHRELEELARCVKKGRP